MNIIFKNIVRLLAIFMFGLGLFYFIDATVFEAYEGLNIYAFICSLTISFYLLAFTRRKEEIAENNDGKIKKFTKSPLKNQEMKTVPIIEGERFE